MRAIKTKDFWRIRVGIQKKRRVDAMDLVLKKFTPEEKKIVLRLEKMILDILLNPLFVLTVRV